MFLSSPSTPIYNTSGEEIILNGQTWETTEEPNLLMNHGNGRYYGRFTFVGKEKMGHEGYEHPISAFALDLE